MNVVVACVDFSESPPAVVDSAERLVAQASASLYLLHVGKPEPDFVGYDVGPQSVRDVVAHELRGEHRSLAALCEASRARGFDARPMMLRGPFADSLLASALKLNADVIVVGSHGHSTLRQVIVGSVTHQVLRLAKVPVLVVPSAARIENSAEPAH